MRTEFIPLEDLRDAWNPAKVLHAAVEHAGIATTGDIPPYLSELSADQVEHVEVVVRKLLDGELGFDRGVAAL